MNHPPKDHVWMPVRAPEWMPVRCACGLERSHDGQRVVYRQRGQMLAHPPRCPGVPLPDRGQPKRKAKQDALRASGLCVLCKAPTGQDANGRTYAHCASHRHEMAVASEERRKGLRTPRRRFRQDPMPWARKAAS